MSNNSKLLRLNRSIIRCKKCPRLSRYIHEVAKNKVKRFKNQKYWGKPLTGFGDFTARLLIVGLAPAAHGGNRTGRMFTGDSSGDWVAKTLFDNGFASQKNSDSKNDGFQLFDAYITAAVRCAPPENKPTKEEFKNCSSFLEHEFEILKNVKIIVCLGHIAYSSTCKLLQIKKTPFSHGKIIDEKGIKIICSYHPSRQNTQTGRLTWEEWNLIFKMAKKLIST